MNWLDIAGRMAGAAERPLWFALAVIELAVRGKPGLLLKHFHVDAGSAEQEALAAQLHTAFGPAPRGAAR